MVVWNLVVYSIKQLFQLQKLLPEWREHFVRNSFKNLAFCQKAQNLLLFRPYDFVQISQVCDINIFKECMERL